MEFLVFNFQRVVKPQAEPSANSFLRLCWVPSTLACAPLADYLIGKETGDPEDNP